MAVLSVGLEDTLSLLSLTLYLWLRQSPIISDFMLMLMTASANQKLYFPHAFILFYYFSEKCLALMIFFSISFSPSSQIIFMPTTNFGFTSELETNWINQSLPELHIMICHCTVKRGGSKYNIHFSLHWLNCGDLTDTNKFKFKAEH